ncbi:MAG TPA: uracil phosphoribosyltransferase [Saprospiraceae bacterium]|nr:uracil phosphoribosyltransferase [Saprospiraceae bacterium]
MIHNLSSQASIASDYLLQMRDETIQLDPVLFRRNLYRFGQIMAYEISKKLRYEPIQTVTPLGVAECQKLNENIVLSTILRAGLPMHDGMLSVFDKAENAFISAYRHNHKDGTFEISLEYISSPELDDKVLIICDPMLATGASMVKSVEALLEYGSPREIHIAAIIASSAGLEYIQLAFPSANIWIGNEDEELTARSYIVPGLGDAGDLAYGKKTYDGEE